jgi:uncharacterized protein YidB (DUF937 family)
MGLFDDLTGSILGGSGGSNNQLVETAINLINNHETGGLADLVKSFTESGLGEAISSWIGTGQNLGVSGEQIASALGSDRIAEISQKLGLGEQDAANGLAGLLPELIDKLTPDGRLPENDMLAQGINILKGKLFG